MPSGLYDVHDSLVPAQVFGSVSIALYLNLCACCGQVVAESKNTEAFLALCLLTVAGAAYTTNSLGFSDTMGAFMAGVLLSETNYKTQVYSCQQWILLMTNMSSAYEGW
jgi:Kef-type K+ transport system membrane component KefB